MTYLVGKNVRCVIAAAALVVSSAAACTTTAATEPPKPPTTAAAAQVTDREVCDSLREFLVDDFDALDAVPERPEEIDDDPIFLSTICTIRDATAPKVYGRISIHEVGSGPNPVGPMPPYDSPTRVDGEIVWVKDERAVGGYTDYSVYFKATVAGWFAEMRIRPPQIRTREGTLEFTPTEQEEASRFLVDLLRKIAEAQDE